MKEKGKYVAAWFEIPANDMKRAVAFYEKTMGVTLKREEMCGMSLAVFPYSPEGSTGCVMAKPGAPSDRGVTVYLNADGMLTAAMGRVERAGGKLRGPVVQLPMGMGSFVHIEDTEGNLIGLHDSFMN